VDYIRQAADWNNLNIAEQEFPLQGGDDFGVFTNQFKGALLGIGAGVDTPALHQPTYDFPDAILPTGIELLASIMSLVVEE